MEQCLISAVFWNCLTKSLCRARISGRNFTSLSSVSWKRKGNLWVRLCLDKPVGSTFMELLLKCLKDNNIFHIHSQDHSKS